jgi:hypothetical protein
MTDEGKVERRQFSTLPQLEIAVHTVEIKMHAKRGGATKSQPAV